MIPYIQKMAVVQRRWLDDLAFSRGLALCQVLPGATAMQMAAYVGLRSRGAWGALSCYFGFALPAFIMMMILSHLYQQSRDLPLVSTLFGGLQVVVVAIVANAAVSFGLRYLLHGRHAVISLFSALMFVMKFHPILVILLAALSGLLAFRGPTYPAGESETLKIHRVDEGLLITLVASAVGAILLYLLDQDLFKMAALVFRIDLFAFGGGLASLPLMLHEFVEMRGWLDSRTFLDGLALGQVTPGPIVITATFVGYMIYGPLGGLVATVSIFLPSLLLVLAFDPCFALLIIVMGLDCRM
jgi:chromate transporter